MNAPALRHRHRLRINWSKWRRRMDSRAYGQERGDEEAGRAAVSPPSNIRSASATMSTSRPLNDRRWSPADGLAFSNEPATVIKSADVKVRTRPQDPAYRGGKRRRLGHLKRPYTLEDAPAAPRPEDYKRIARALVSGDWQQLVREDSSDGASARASDAGRAFKRTEPLQASAAASPDNDGLEGGEKSANKDEDADSDESESPEEEEDIYKPLSYQIPDAVLKEAEKTQAYWSYQMYRGPSDDKVIRHYITTKDKSEEYAKMFLGKPALGLDMEWKQYGNRKKLKDNVSLIQLACDERIALFHIALHKGDAIEDVLAPSLKKILESPDVLKCGVNIKGDYRKLREHLGIVPAGLFELSHLHKLVLYGATEPKLVNRVMVNLAVQTKIHLGLPLYKGEERTSDWSRPLSIEQCKYASDDVYASFRLFDALQEKWSKLDPRPPFPHCAETDLPIRLAPQPASEVESESDESVEMGAEEEEPLDESLAELEIGAAESADEFGDNAFEGLSDAELAGLEGEQEKASDRPGSSKTKPKKRLRYPDLPADAAEQQFVGRVRLKPKFKQPPTLAETAASIGAPHPAKVPEAEATSTELPEEAAALLVEADNWATGQRQQSRSTSVGGALKNSNKQSPAQLRAYYLWQYRQLDIEGIALILRRPPVLNATVAGYVAECITFGNYPWSDKKALRRIIEFLPYQAKGRYWRLQEILDNETNMKDDE